MKKKRTELVQGKWELRVPHYVQPEGQALGWYFIYEARDGLLASMGPYVSRDECARIIATREQCYRCSADIFDDRSADEHAYRQATRGGAVALCGLCEPEFVAWHRKTYGEDPVPWERGRLV